MAGHKISKTNSIKKWIKGVNSKKNINNPTYERNKRGGIRLTGNS